MPRREPARWPVVSQPAYVKWHTAAVQAEDSIPGWEQAADAARWQPGTDDDMPLLAVKGFCPGPEAGASRLWPCTYVLAPGF
jgi:hypothetical protein